MQETHTHTPSANHQTEACIPVAHSTEQAPSGLQDPLYHSAVQVVRANGRVSISLVQRCLKIGYKTAARLIEAMEIAGVISPEDRAGRRTILPIKPDTAPSAAIGSAEAAGEGVTVIQSNVLDAQPASPDEAQRIAGIFANIKGKTQAALGISHAAADLPIDVVHPETTSTQSEAPLVSRPGVFVYTPFMRAAKHVSDAHYFSESRGQVYVIGFPRHSQAILAIESNIKSVVLEARSFMKPPDLRALATQLLRAADYIEAHPAPTPARTTQAPAA